MAQCQLGAHRTWLPTVFHILCFAKLWKLPGVAPDNIRRYSTWQALKHLPALTQVEQLSSAHQMANRLLAKAIDYNQSYYN